MTHGAQNGQTSIRQRKKRQAGILLLLCSFVGLVAVAPANAADAIQVETISAGGSHTCAIRASGQAVCWGNNWDAQLGDGTTTSRLNPTSVSGLDDAEHISAGYLRTCAIRTSGQAVCWGNNWDGALGDGTETVRLTPTPVSGLSDAVSISAGGLSHTCAIRISGQAVCWGKNSSGQLGDGTETNRLSPVPVSGLSDTTEISAGVSHTCAIRTSGQAVCWGDNSFGRLGDGTTTNRLTPASVSGLDDAVTISAGSRHVCAIRASDQAVCWGSNSSGQVGDGTTENRLIPTLVVEGESESPPVETCATNAALCPLAHPVPVLPTPPAPPTPGSAFFAGVGQVKGGVALFRTRCSGDTACRGVARLTARVRTKRSVKQRGGQRMARRARNVVIGKGRFNIAPGKAGTVRIRLTGAGKKLLRQGGRRALRARLVGRGIKGRTVMLKPRGGKQQRRRAKRAMAQASSTLKQRCVQAGTGRPKVLKAMMRHPGDRKTQSISIEADYRAMPEECRGVFRRIPEVKFQIQNPKNHRQWFNFSRFRRAVKAFKAAEKELNEVQEKREEQGRECTISNPCSINPRINDKGGLSDMRHSAPLSRFPKGDRRLYRCTPGKRVTQVRALLRNKVKRIGTDRIIEQRTYKAPIRVKRFKYLLPKHRKRGHVRGPC